MFTVYILYSLSSTKTYVGFTNDINRRMNEHNITETKGFTLKYRPWTLISTENFVEKKQAIQREKFLKTGMGRDFVKQLVVKYLSTQNQDL